MTMIKVAAPLGTWYLVGPSSEEWPLVITPVKLHLYGGHTT
jgi:hypothetical protein